MDKKFNFRKVVKLLCYSLLLLVAIIWTFEKLEQQKEVPRSERVADLVLKSWPIYSGLGKAGVKTGKAVGPEGSASQSGEAGVVGPGGFSDSDIDCVITPSEAEVLIELKGLSPFRSLMKYHLQLMKREHTDDVAFYSQEMSDETRSNYKLMGFLSIHVQGDCMSKLPMVEIREVASQKAMKAGADALEEKGLMDIQYRDGIMEEGTFMYSLYKKDGYDTSVIKLENSTVTVPCEMVVRSSLLDKEEKFEKTPNVYLAPEEKEDFIRANFSMIGYISVSVTGDCVEDTAVQDTYDVAKQEAMKIGADVITVPKYGDTEEDSTFFFYWCYKLRKEPPFKPYHAEPYKNDDYYEKNTNRKYEL
jgi:hypothetical protein